MATYEVNYKVTGDKPTDLPEGATVKQVSPLPHRVEVNGAELLLRERKRYGGRPTIAELSIDAGRGFEKRTFGLNVDQAEALGNALIEAAKAERAKPKVSINGAPWIGAWLDEVFAPAAAPHPLGVRHHTAMVNRRNRRA